MIREIEEHAKISEEVRLDVLASGVPQSSLEAVVKVHGLKRKRDRKLSMEMGLQVMVMMSLFAELSLDQVLWKLMSGVRDVWDGEGCQPATASAFSQLRYQMGAQVVVDLFHQLCKPMAKRDTVGAFYQDLRLMAIDGSVQNIADTSELDHYFGRQTNQSGEAGYPQGQAVYLIEVGSRAVVDAGLWPYLVSERKGARRMLRSVGPGMLVLWDAGLYSYAMVAETCQREAHFLCRLPSQVQPEYVQRLSDGSQLVYLIERDPHGKRTGRKRLVRLIEYTIDDPALPHFGETHRLITSLLDPLLYPALELARLYHERWEVEIMIDETDTHLRQAFHPFRSRRPIGVVQEFFAMLIAHYALRKIILEAAHLAKIDPDRISFSNALHLVRDAFPKFQTFAQNAHPPLYQRLLRDLARFCLPARADRSNPRVVKRKMSNFDRKRPEHALWPKPRGALADAIVLI
jgi:hypothetical protein